MSATPPTSTPLPHESERDDAVPLANQVVARSHIGTAFYLFSHQAGGHKPFLRSALGEVCKPAIPLELQFYQALDTRFPQLKPFVPPFVGVITVDLHPVAPATATATATAATSGADSDGGDGGSDADATSASGGGAKGVVEGEMMRVLQLRSPTKPVAGATPPPTANTAVTMPSPGGKKRRFHDTTRRAGESPSTSPSGPTRSFISTASYSAKLWRKERSKQADAAAAATAAGALARTGSSGSLGALPSQPPPQPPRAGAASSVSREYLVLGDLTRAYSRPCVLDVKMGTRQHGEDAPPAKATSHTAKCAATTSLELGLRICGMQVYDEVEQRYILWDKHWGRRLKKHDIEPALTTYLSNGLGLHAASLRALRDKLRALERVIARTTGVRFWGSSLLLIYEGDLRHAARREDLHLIDFAHCQMHDALATPDDGLLRGLANLIQFLTNILDATATAGDHLPA